MGLANSFMKGQFLPGSTPTFPATTRTGSGVEIRCGMIAGIWPLPLSHKTSGQANQNICRSSRGTTMESLITLVL